MTSKKILPQCDVLFYITPSQGLISQEFIPVHDLNVPQRGVQITEKALKVLKINKKFNKKKPSKGEELFSFPRFNSSNYYL